MSYLEEEMNKYASGRGRAATRASRKTRKDEDDLLAEMSSFSKTIANLQPVLLEPEPEPTMISPEEEPVNGNDHVQEKDERIVIRPEEEGLEVDDDAGWKNHTLRFVVNEKELTRRAEDEYAVGVSEKLGNSMAE